MTLPWWWMNFICFLLRDKLIILYYYKLSMKKLLFWIIIISLISITHADYKTIVTTVLNDIQTTNNNKTDLQKRQNFQNYIPKIQKLTVVDQRVRDALITYLNAKIAEIDKTLKTTTYESNITNIDKALVEKTWLELHNLERKSLGLSEYTISPELNNTAQNRANHLITLTQKELETQRTHRRSPSDPYYSYEKIKERFSNLWVTFPKEKNGIANFSESNTYQYLNCKKTDCTNEVITAIKKWYNFFMSEKSYKWPHYNAIISPHFSKMWYGIAKVGTRIFIVTHYSVDF